MLSFCFYSVCAELSLFTQNPQWFENNKNETISLEAGLFCEIVYETWLNWKQVRDGILLFDNSMVWLTIFHVKNMKKWTFLLKCGHLDKLCHTRWDWWSCVTHCGKSCVEPYKSAYYKKGWEMHFDAKSFFMNQMAPFKFHKGIYKKNMA